MNIKKLFAKFDCEGKEKQAVNVKWAGAEGHILNDLCFKHTRDLKIFVLTILFSSNFYTQCWA